ncbi:NUDIX hydrolase [Bifidobacterium pseudolongum]|uniref:NUDIX hydrolase n=1 Tax=Bifidobacterium pseudolongum TaxID=1694 RepID=UPI0003B7230E|nr:NUDIX domain-containing protein [Bifidobacterium pseudolongum]ASW23644.1 NUDIX domain protein [Bifidobacterium pseudolongum]
MSTPEFILELRERIDHMPLWLIGVTGYVRRDDGLILLEQRADNGNWTLVTGINEPGEEPADTVAREAKEETGVDVIVTDLVNVKSDHEIKTYRNGDQTWYMDHLFLCEVAPNGNSEPAVGDDESTSVDWFSLDALPEPLAASSRERIGYVQQYLKHRAQGDARAQFAFDGVIEHL